MRCCLKGQRVFRLLRQILDALPVALHQNARRTAQLGLNRLARLIFVFEKVIITHIPVAVGIDPLVLPEAGYDSVCLDPPLVDRLLRLQRNTNPTIMTTTTTAML